MKIALTFDDGPHPGRTPEILDILDKYQVKATFFVVGENVNYYPDVFCRIVAEGHEIGNHTYSHCKLDKGDTDLFIDEMSKFESIISIYCNKNISIIRPPEGKYSSSFENFAQSNDLNIILWSIDTKDWAHSSPESIINNVLSNASGGDIILMHDFISGSSPTPEALNKIIPELLSRGFEFVTISELISKTPA